jgi:hypothetical protein
MHVCPPVLATPGKDLAGSPEGHLLTNGRGAIDINVACGNAAFRETMDDMSGGKNHVNQMFISGISKQTVQEERRR